ncbi:MAG: glycerophosphodiester phosphodiesterase family protein [Beijerinckiaceae bacterium]|nr:glycerophosphodiester phosphodiesterase family protein [Beijerinckiaceae bacterium]
MNLNWLVARPIAHRGKHDRARGVIENSFDAADGARASGCAIECDVQMSADGEAFVFHDETLDRLIGATGCFRDKTSAELARMQLVGSVGNASIPTLGALLNRIAGRVPLIIEIKSLFDGDMRLAERTARLAADHAGCVALKSFDPAIVAHLRRSGLCEKIPLGIVAEARFDDAEWAFLGKEQKQSLACLLHWRETQPDFLSFCVRDLPHAAVTLARVALRMPVMTWTVRTPKHWDIARRHADQAIFEGPLP